MPHPWQAGGARTDAQAAVKSTQPGEREDTGFAVLPAEGDVAWRLGLSCLQPRRLWKVEQAYQALAGTSIAVGGIVVSQP